MIVIACKNNLESYTSLDPLLGFLKKTGTFYKMLRSFPYSHDETEILKDATFIVTVGGDGTLLHAIQAAGFSETPILPLHSGTLGFICSVNLERAGDFFKALYEDSAGFTSFKKSSVFQFDDRWFLNVCVNGISYDAFNEMALTRVTGKALLPLNVRFQDKYEVSFKADGVLISTASGSTAYNLSAGGPILSPGVRAYVFTPICPHSVTMKPVVISGEEKLEVSSCGRDDTANLEIDGRFTAKAGPETNIKCMLSDRFIRLIKPSDEVYYKVLRDKLKWSL